jgi:hypothetical protein
MKINGKQLIKVITQRLKFEGKGHGLDDTTILNRIRELNEFELREIITFGYLAEWIREENGKNQKLA